AFLAGHEKAILALEPVDDALLAKLPELKVISKFGVGLDGLDLEALERRGVQLAWTGGTNSRSVAELALMMIIALLRRVPAASAELKAGTFRQTKGNTLSGKTVGLVGGGAVGRDLARLLAPFDVRILCSDPAPDHAALNALDIETVELDALLRESDVVSVHAPLTPGTRGLIGAKNLALMKPSAILINTARGGLVDETALKEALKAGKLAGAGLDVFEVEPPKDAELFALPSVLATPHIGGSTEEAILAMGRAAIAGLDAARPARDFKR
ncbi:MAG TPA: phosphoglycerate dehydrogenase, partial [Elusimicrobiota bacterium]|nr:phosphoglycerate dehydrogenase [Elusimicrobiota bacterium]